MIKWFHHPNFSVRFNFLQEKSSDKNLTMSARVQLDYGKDSINMDTNRNQTVGKDYHLIHQTLLLALTFLRPHIELPLHHIKAQFLHDRGGKEYRSNKQISLYCFFLFHLLLLFFFNEQSVHTSAKKHWTEGRLKLFSSQR